MARLKLSAAVVVATCALLVAGCGGGSSSQVSPTAYVGAVCSTVDTWLRDVEARSGQVSRAHPSTGAQGQRVLRTFIGAVVADTDRAVTSLKHAGVPKVNNGKQVSTALVNAFASIKSVLQSSQAEVATLPIANPSAFRRAANKLGSSVQQSLAGIGSSLTALRSPELEKAGSSAPACKRLSSLG